MSRRQSLRRNIPTSFPIQDNEGVAKQEIKFPHEIANPIRMNACVVKHSILISTAYLWKALSRHACFEFELLSLQNFAKLNLSQTCFPVHYWRLHVSNSNYWVFKTSLNWIFHKRVFQYTTWRLLKTTWGENRRSSNSLRLIHLEF